MAAFWAGHRNLDDALPASTAKQTTAPRNRCDKVDGCTPYFSSPCHCPPLPPVGKSWPLAACSPHSAPMRSAQAAKKAQRQRKFKARQRVKATSYGTDTSVAYGARRWASTSMTYNASSISSFRGHEVRARCGRACQNYHLLRSALRKATPLGSRAQVTGRQTLLSRRARHRMCLW